MRKRRIQTDKMCVELVEKDLVKITVFKNVLFELEDYIQLADIIRSFGTSDKYRSLAVFEENALPDEATRKVGASHEGSTYKIAEAFVIHTVGQKVMAETYLVKEKPVTPTRFFDNEQDALDWLNTF